MTTRVAVVGAGISGLTAALALVEAERDLAVTLYEGSSRLGGKLRLEEVAGVPVDVGAESVLARRPEAVELFDELGLADRVTHPAGLSASIIAAGTRWPMPKGTLMGIPSDPESVRGILTDQEVDRLVAERPPHPTGGDVSVGDFIDERLGRAVTDKLIEPLLAGVYAGHARNISLDMALPALARAAHDGQSVLAIARAAAGPADRASAGAAAPAPVFATLTGGIGSLPQVMKDRLVDSGVLVRTDTLVRRLERRGDVIVVTSGPTIDVHEEAYDAVILATPAAPTARLLREVAPEAAARLARIEYASMAIVTFALDCLPDLLEGSGFLVPPTEPLTIKAATFSSAKWPWLAAAYPDRTFLRASLGRHREEATLHRSDDELAEIARRDLATVLGAPLADVVGVHVQRWGGALPQYAVGHRQLVADLTEPADGVALCGAAYDGVGIAACIASGRRAAGAILTRVQTGV